MRDVCDCVNCFLLLRIRVWGSVWLLVSVLCRVLVGVLRCVCMRVRV